MAVPIKEVSLKADIVKSHILYKIKQNDDKSLKLKPRVAAHRNEEELKDLFSKECSACPRTGISKPK